MTIPTDEHGRTVRSGNRRIEDTLLDKLSKLKNSAEGEKAIGNEAAAQAFAEMFQRLVLRHKIDLTEVEFDALDADEPVGLHIIDYAKHNMRPKKRRSAWLERLGHVVAEAHFCRILVHPGSSRISLAGRKSDTEVAEYALVTLQRAAEKMAHKAYYKYWFDLFVICQHCDGPKDGHDEHCKAQGYSPHKFESATYRASGFKASWLDGFVSRLAERYREVRQGHTGESTALVRVNKAEKAVINFIEENYKKKAEGLVLGRRSHGDGLRAGRAAADKLELGGNPKVVKGAAKSGLLEG